MADFNGFLALGNTGVDGVTFTELSGAAGYARRPIALTPSLGGRLRNTATVAFPANSGASAWPSFDSLAIYDALTGGQRLMSWFAPAITRPMLAGAVFAITPGGIELAFPVVRSNHGSEVIMSGPFALSGGQFMPSAPVVPLTQAAYDALASKDPRTVYAVTGS